jgi:hypothetical protein
MAGPPNGCDGNGACPPRNRKCDECDPPVSEPEPILVSDASRKAMLRFAATNDPVHEILADAIYQAEQRGVRATLSALGVFHDRVNDALVVPSGRFPSEGLERKIKRELGR